MRFSKPIPVFPVRIVALIVGCCCFISICRSQSIDSTQQKVVDCFTNISSKSLRSIDEKYDFIQRLIEKQTERLLKRMQKREARLQQLLQSKDSVKSQQLFASTQAKYQQFLSQIQSPANNNAVVSAKQYIPGLDSMQTALKFLNQGVTIPGISSNKLQQIQTISNQLQLVQTRLQQSGNVQDYIRQREQLLKIQLSQYGLGKPLLHINQQVYYYQQQIAEYKNMLNDKDKMQQAVLNTVKQIPAFQTFWQKYSLLSKLFPLPANYGTSQAIAGLQTRTAIQAILQRAGASIGANTGYIQQEVQQAQSTLSTLKNKVSNLSGSTGSGDVTMPDFKPNPERTKRGLQRLEYGFNIQNASGTNLLPATTTIGVTIGYKFSSNATAGIGSSYIVGLGSGLKDIHITNQGVGLRSFIDIRAKGSLWVTGGFEYTYYQQFSKFSDIKNLDVWQKSILLGLTKKYTLGKRTANIQLLYDFLYSIEVPRGQPFKFRLGYSL